MPNAPTHALAAVPSGAAFSLFRARNEPGAACEALGGAIGGWIGGKAPDYFDPATCWNHRRFCHSWAVLGAGVFLTEAVLTGWEKFCRTKANEIAWRLAHDPSLSGLARLLYSGAEILWRTTAGMLGGFLAGYISHLALDAFTVSSLPLFGLSCSDNPPPRVSSTAVPQFVDGVTMVGLRRSGGIPRSLGRRGRRAARRLVTVIPMNPC